MSIETFDVVILGGGNAGIGVTGPVRRAGMSIAMIESHDLGGTCPNRGCTPKKVLVAAGHALHEFERAAVHHISVGKPKLDALITEVLGCLHHAQLIDGDEEPVRARVVDLDALGILPVEGDPLQAAIDTDVALKTSLAPPLTFVPGVDAPASVINSTTFRPFSGNSRIL